LPATTGSEAGSYLRLIDSVSLNSRLESNKEEEDQLPDCDQIIIPEPPDVYRSSPECSDLQCKPGVSKTTIRALVAERLVYARMTRMNKWRRDGGTLNPRPSTLNSSCSVIFVFSSPATHRVLQRKRENLY